MHLNRCMKFTARCQHGTSRFNSRRQTPNWRLETARRKTTNRHAMNTEPTTPERQKLVAQAADDYTLPPPQSHALLMPLRDSLATLRRKGASYRSIVRILRNVDINVSLDTLSRFCREFIEEKPARKDRRRPAVRPAAGRETMPPPPPASVPSEVDSPASSQPPKQADHSAPRGKGPRIADPSSI